MPEHFPYQDEDLFNPATAREQSDVPVRPLWWAVVIFIVFAALSHGALWLLYRGFVRAERGRMPPPQTAVARPASADVPQNQPLLQPFPTAPVPNANTPVTDLQYMRAAEERALTSYGWVDRQRGIVRIPIEVAKERMVAGGGK